jgi:hypothetical protein
MKLLKITKNGSLHFELSDGRVGVTYTNGYVRVSTKSPNRYNSKTPVYQINKQVFTDAKDSPSGYTFVKRELIPNHIDRIQHLMNFNNKNCQN